MQRHVVVIMVLMAMAWGPQALFAFELWPFIPTQRPLQRPSPSVVSIPPAWTVQPLSRQQPATVITPMPLTRAVPQPHRPGITPVLSFPIQPLTLGSEIALLDPTPLFEPVMVVLEHGCSLFANTFHGFDMFTAEMYLMDDGASMPSVEALLVDGVEPQDDALLGALLQYDGISLDQLDPDGRVHFTTGVLQFLDPDVTDRVLAEVTVQDPSIDAIGQAFSADIRDLDLIAMPLSASPLAGCLLTGPGTIQLDPTLLVASNDFTTSALVASAYLLEITTWPLIWPATTLLPCIEQQLYPDQYPGHEAFTNILKDIYNKVMQDKIDFTQHWLGNGAAAYASNDIKTLPRAFPSGPSRGPRTSKPMSPQRTPS
jgi:hypothetical protein